ncbi:hypothetical protein [Ornithinibacillus californiensis]|uniref:hypothetical protein n=1 Tax=Ornithinibacillus californiensis TaxID=161536 RepID=UPI00064DD03A|nr:hypothetical protein [Ornithinibacillus californiensis]
MRSNRIQLLIWSSILPGIGQFMNQKYMKGIVLIALVLIVNIQSNYNETIILSLYGNTDEAIKTIDYQWLLFYPCIYFFAMYDAFKDAKGKDLPYSFLPFVFATYTATLGIIFSSNFRVWGVQLGPVFLPALFLLPGLLVGYIMMRLLGGQSP